MIIAMAGILLSATGCFGKFALTRKVYQWNESIAGDDLGGKFVKTLVMYGLFIVPVYEVAGTIDFIILNLIEFWTGSNPVAMNDGEKEIQIIEQHGNKYEITATRNRFEIKQLTGEKKGDIHIFAFDPDQLSWEGISNGESARLIQYEVENGDMVSATYFGENNQCVIVDEAQLNNYYNQVASR